MIRSQRHVLTTLVLSCASCASIVSSGDDPVKIVSRETGTKIFVDGQYLGDDAVTCNLKRGNDHVVRGEKDGFTPTTVTTTSKLDPWIFGNIIFGGIIGIIIDLVADNAQKLSPADYDVTPRSPQSQPSST